MPDRTYHLGLGGNVGDVRGSFHDACERLSLRGTHLTARSAIYETLPVGPADQPFLNAAVEVRTDLPPSELLTLCKRLEHDAGRRPTQRWDNRPLDVDILLGNEPFVSETLTVPHAMLAVRMFALLPLADIAGDRVIDSVGRTVSELVAHWSALPLRVAYRGLRPSSDSSTLAVEESALPAPHVILDGRPDPSAPTVSDWPPVICLDRFPLPTAVARRDAALAGMIDRPNRSATQWS